MNLNLMNKIEDFFDRQAISALNMVGCQLAWLRFVISVLSLIFCRNLFGEYSVIVLRSGAPFQHLIQMQVERRSGQFHHVLCKIFLNKCQPYSSATSPTYDLTTVLGLALVLARRQHRVNTVLTPGSTKTCSRFSTLSLHRCDLTAGASTVVNTVLTRC